MASLLIAWWQECSFILVKQTSYFCKLIKCINAFPVYDNGQIDNDDDCVINCWMFWFVDGTFGWLAKGRVLEVFSMRTGERRAAWCFGSAAADMKTLITAVCQFGTDRRATWLAVATAQQDFSSFKIYLFSVYRSSIAKAIQLPCVVRLHEFRIH